MVVALDDCTSSVTIAPQNAPESGVAAALLSTVRSAEPARPFRPSVMTVMPSKKRPTPPRMEIVVDMVWLNSADWTGAQESEAAAKTLGSGLALKLRARGRQFLLLLRVHLRIGE